MPDDTLDLPAEMFRSGTTVEETTIQMPRRHFGPVNVQVKFTEIDGQGLFEGDIVLGPVGVIRRIDDLGARGLGIAGPEYRWPNGVIPYATEAALQATVTVAVNHWHTHTPIQLVARTNEVDYLSFQQKTGCWSQVGRQGGEQTISLGPGCGPGAAIHEIGHALGLFHEQSRSDRDDHIEIVWANIDPQYRHNFDAHVQDATDLGPYDYGSIMHYPPTAFSVNKQPTIRVRGGQAIGQRQGLSAGDIESVKLMYPKLNWANAGT
jgi:hypothetical protein